MKKSGIVFMAIGDNEVDSEPYVDDGIYWIGDESFPLMKEAFDHLFYLYRELLAELKSNKKKIKHLRRDVEYDQDQKEEIKIKLLESRCLMDSYDATRFDSLKIEFGEAKKKIANLELVNSKLEENKLESILLVTSLNDELSKLDQQVVEYTSKVARLESELSSLNKGKAIESYVTSVSPSCEQNLLNERIKLLELENVRLKGVIKNFTRSQTRMDQMIDGLVPSSSKHGLGYQNVKSKKKPRIQSNFFAKFLNNSSGFNNDDPYYSTKLKVRCHYCCLKGHVNGECFVRRHPQKYEWVAKQPTNMVGTAKRLPLDASLAGA